MRPTIEVTNAQLWELILFFDRIHGKIKNGRALLLLAYFKKQLEKYTVPLVSTNNELRLRIPVRPDEDAEQVAVQEYEDALEAVNTEWVDVLNQTIKLDDDIKPIPVTIFEDVELTEKDAALLATFPLIDLTPLFDN